MVCICNLPLLQIWPSRQYAEYFVSELNAASNSPRFDLHMYIETLTLDRFTADRFGRRGQRLQPVAALCSAIARRGSLQLTEPRRRWYICVASADIAAQAGFAAASNTAIQPDESPFARYAADGSAPVNFCKRRPWRWIYRAIYIGRRLLPLRAQLPCQSRVTICINSP